MNGPGVAIGNLTLWIVRGDDATMPHLQVLIQVSAQHVPGGVTIAPDRTIANSLLPGVVQLLLAQSRLAKYRAMAASIGFFAFSAIGFIGLFNSHVLYSFHID